MPQRLAGCGGQGVIPIIFALSGPCDTRWVMTVDFRKLKQVAALTVAAVLNVYL